MFNDTSELTLHDLGIKIDKLERELEHKEEELDDLRNDISNLEIIIDKLENE